MNPEGLNIIVMDLETKVLVTDWNDYGAMGISVGCAYDYREGRYLTFMDDNLEALRERIQSADLVVGFNIGSFDLPLLMHFTAPMDFKMYDILRESRVACGWRPDDNYSRYPKGLKLDNHLEGTFGQKFMKTDHGANAPGLWQAGKIGELTTYCLADVHREKMLFEHVCKFGWVQTEAHGRKYLRNPFGN